MREKGYTNRKLCKIVGLKQNVKLLSEYLKICLELPIVKKQFGFELYSNNYS